MKIEEITKEIVGLMFNGVMVLKLTDGTMDTVPDHIFRYKFPIKDGYAKDKEDKTIIVEVDHPLSGYNLNGKQVGTELIDVRCGDPNDKFVWWIVDPVFQKVIIDRDPVTKRPITSDKILNLGTSTSGTYEEFLAVVNGRSPKPETPEFADIPGTPAPDEFSDEDVKFITANYKTMSDEDMATEIGADAELLKEFRLKTLNLRKNR